MKKIEVLYKEFQHLYADLWNPMYLDMCNDEIEVIYTPFGKEPYFNKHHVDMIYMGSVPDNKIPVIIDALKPYKKKIKELIEDNTLFLITGNAIEVFGSEIKERKNTIDGLKVLNYRVEKNMDDKHISWFKGKFNGMDIIGHKNQFSRLYQEDMNFIETIDGWSSNYEDTNEGIKYKNFFATYLLGPICILNPNFAKYVLSKMGLDDNLACEEDILASFNKRMEDMSKMDTFIQGDRG